MEINHFSHKHPLIPCIDVDKMYFASCDMCEGEISAKVPSLCCSDTDCGLSFLIHQSCTELEREITHPLHPQHPLALLEVSPDSASRNYPCSVCNLRRFPSFVYHCSDCRFNLHVHCASLLPAPQAPSTQQQYHLGQIQSFILCNKRNGFVQIQCSVCSELFENQSMVIYVCLERNLLLHKSCVDLQLQIQHPFHPQHPLALLLDEDPRGPTYVCHVCGIHHDGYYTFHCSHCNFNLHIKCASLNPVNGISSPQDHRIEYINQTHPLIPCTKGEKFYKFSCSACRLPISDDSIILVCLQCHVLLHKSCTQLPQQINHPFHQKHPLNLIEQSFEKNQCSICVNTPGDINYFCEECKITTCVQCAFPVPAIKNFKFHQHPLAFFNRNLTNSFNAGHIPCTVCNLYFYTPFFHCVECKFRVHVHCIPGLPSTIKHECHLHPLTFTKKPIKDRSDREDAEFYCDTCEKRRHLPDATYYCETCLYVAHVLCVISEVLPLLEENSYPACELDDTNRVKEDINTTDGGDSDSMTEIEQEGATLETNARANEAELTRKGTGVNLTLEYAIGVQKKKFHCLNELHIQRLCEEITIADFRIEVPADPTIAQLDEAIAKLNKQEEALTVKIEELEQIREDLVKNIPVGHFMQPTGVVPIIEDGVTW